MFKFYLLALILFVSPVLHVQENLEGLWRGAIINAYQDVESADVIYIYIDSTDQLNGLARIEKLNSEDFALKNFTGKIKNDEIQIKEQYIKSSTHSRDAPKCKLDYNLKYNSETGYLKGSYISSDCRNKVGEIILYRSEGDINTEKDPKATHYWKYQFAANYVKGYPAPEILEKEKENFEFKPIYFDHDKSEIKPEFHEYLNKMAWIIDAIHDLRIKVIGHTDAVGTDAYNIGLSERRAKSIKAYFLSRGIEEDKLEIDFKGERMPIDTNKTPEGKQRNRRVDFEFI